MKEKEKEKEKEEMEIEEPNRISQFELHREMIDKASPLSLIREKEIELGTVVLKAKKKAESILAQARKEAAALREGAVDSGVKKGQDKYKKGIEEAKREAESIRDSAAQEVAKAKKLGEKSLDKAIQKILDVILP